jgi:hypothetical protein
MDENLIESHTASLDIGGRDWREFFGITFKVRPGGMCSGPQGTIHDNLLKIYSLIFLMFNS